MYSGVTKDNEIHKNKTDNIYITKINETHGDEIHCNYL